MVHYEKFLEFKRSLRLEKSAFNGPMDPWEFKFYLEKAKEWNLDEGTMVHLNKFLDDIQKSSRRNRYVKKADRCRSDR